MLHACHLLNDKKVFPSETRRHYFIVGRSTHSQVEINQWTFISIDRCLEVFFMCEISKHRDKILFVKQRLSLGWIKFVEFLGRFVLFFFFNDNKLGTEWRLYYFENIVLYSEAYKMRTKMWRLSERSLVVNKSVFLLYFN